MSKEEIRSIWGDSKPEQVKRYIFIWYFKVILVLPAQDWRFTVLTLIQLSGLNSFIILSLSLKNFSWTMCRFRGHFKQILKFFIYRRHYRLGITTHLPLIWVNDRHQFCFALMERIYNFCVNFSEHISNFFKTKIFWQF